jgi:hypothetical protein
VVGITTRLRAGLSEVRISAQPEDLSPAECPDQLLGPTHPAVQ